MEKLLLIALFLSPCQLFAQKNAKQDVASKEKVFVSVEKLPEFPGGDKAMVDFIQKNLKYPETAKRDHVQGLVIVSFIIDKTGTMAQSKIIRGVRQDINEEALRVIKAMPNWIPGTQKGIPVNVRLNLPLQFQLP